jgi:hypothetical protein
MGTGAWVTHMNSQEAVAHFALGNRDGSAANGVVFGDHEFRFFVGGIVERRTSLDGRFS